MTHRFYEAISGIVVLLAIGTVIFQQLEGWGWIDSFYFTGITMLTIGYGDITPTHELSKVLTVLFGFASVALAFYALSAIGTEVSKKLIAMQHNLPFGTSSTGSTVSGKSQQSKKK